MPSNYEAAIRDPRNELIRAQRDDELIEARTKSEADKAYEAGRDEARAEIIKMLNDELDNAKAMAKGNGGNPRYDYFADCIEMLIGNLEE